ncbi:hypothetical protein JTB14_002791 [Gonioctena quinquepunctata]|nr:hypothetical protein JTB14_002791 [Gonioctena quinquepunctata]
MNKNKRHREHLPSVITSAKWFEIAESKQYTKDKENEEKLRRQQKTVKTKKELEVDSTEQNESDRNVLNKIGNTNKHVVNRHEGSRPQILENSANNQELKATIDRYVVIQYEGSHYPGKITQVESNSLLISTMERSGADWKWPCQMNEICKHHFWTTDQAVRLIEPYETHPCLYNAKSKNYHNRNLKAKASTEICDGFKELFPDKPFTEALIKAKIHTLRSQFMSELNKIKKTEASGASPDDIYQPKLWCYQSLQFLEDTCEIVSEGDSNLEQDYTQDSDAEGSALLVDATVDELSAPFSIDAYSSPSTSRSASAASSNREAPNKKVTIQSNANKLQTQSKLPAKKKRKLEEEEYAGILKDCSTAINMLSRPASPPRVEPDNDNENSLFGKYITSEMNKIKDDDILDEFEENVMRELYAAKKLFRQKLN